MWLLKRTRYQKPYARMCTLDLTQEKKDDAFFAQEPPVGTDNYLDRIYMGLKILGNASRGGIKRHLVLGFVEYDLTVVGNREFTINGSYYEGMYKFRYEGV